MDTAFIPDDAPRNRRRVWALAPYGAFGIAGAAYVAVAQLEGPAEVALAVIAAVAVVTALVSAYAVYTWQREWAHQPDDQLDERQQDARDRAYRSAYATLATVGAVALVGSQITLDAVDSLSITQVSSVVVLGWFLLAFCLPSSVLLWREPDLEPAGADA